MVEEKGTISINTENIFPIIKKFLYSDHEIFLRELVSNAVDATQKLKRLSSMGEYTGQLGQAKVTVSVNEKAEDHHGERPRHWHDRRGGQEVYQPDCFFGSHRIF